MRTNVLFPWPILVLLAGCLRDPVPATPDSDTTADTGDSAPETTTETTTETSTDTGVDTDVDTDVDGDIGSDSDAGPDSETDGDTGAEVVDPAPGSWDLAPEGLTQTSTPWVIGNDHFAVTLGASAGWQPQSLVSRDGSGDELVYGMPTGINEAWVGVSLFDLFHVWSDLAAPTVRESGRALVQVRKTWSIASGLLGTTVITVHADGRVVMGYDLTVPSERAGSLVAYATLPIERFSSAQIGADVSVTLPSGQVPSGGYFFFGLGLEDTDYLCAYHASTRDAVGFVSRAVAEFTAPMPRITESASNGTIPHSVRLQWDFQRNNVLAGTYIGRFLMSVDGSGGCARVAALAAAFRAPGTLTMSTGTRVVASAGDSDGDGFNELGGYYVVDAGTGRELRANVGVDMPSVSLRVRGGVWAAPSVSVNGTPLTAGEQFVQQPASDDDGGWVVITKALDSGDAIAIIW